MGFWKNCFVLAGCCFLLSACGSRNEAAIDVAPSFTILQESFNDGIQTEENDVWLKKVEDFTKCNISIISVPTLSYADTVNTKIINNKLPMVMTANETILQSSVFLASVQAGGFWNLDDIIKDYPNLYQFIGEDIWEKSKINGHLYGIPRLRILPRNVLFYRKDWADQLGIVPPGNLDGLYQMLRAFTYDDPDQNGIDDTDGLITCWASWGNHGWNGVQTLTVALGGPNGWRYENQTMVPDFSTEEYMETLDFFKRLYDEKILPSSFLMLNPLQKNEYFEQGKAGATFGVIDDIAEIESKLRKYDTAAEVGILPMLQTSDGNKYVNATKGYNGLIVFNHMGNGSIQTEEQLRQILKYYDTLCTEEGQELINYGIKDVHYTIDQNGNRKLLYDENGESILSDTLNSTLQSFPTQMDIKLAGESEIQEELYGEIEERSHYLVHDDSQGLISETYIENAGILNDIIRQASLRYIIGEINKNVYEKKTEEWLKQGGQTVIEEYTKAYQNSISKQ